MKFPEVQIRPLVLEKRTSPAEAARCHVFFGTGKPVPFVESRGSYRQHWKVKNLVYSKPVRVQKSWNREHPAAALTRSLALSDSSQNEVHPHASTRHAAGTYG